MQMSETQPDHSSLHKTAFFGILFAYFLGFLGGFLAIGSEGWPDKFPGYYCLRKPIIAGIPYA
jgi:hypothetical protein